MKQAVIGIDIGGTKIAAHVSDRDYKSYFESKRALPALSNPEMLEGLAGDVAHQVALVEGRKAMFKTITVLCYDLIARARKQNLEVQAIGIGSTGQVDPDAGMIVDANPNILGWTGASIKETLQAELGLPIILENDVRVMAVAETTLGAGKDYQHVLCITVGTGIGGAIVLGGELWRGAHFSAGEVGFIRVRDGETVETLYSGTGIAKHYNARHTTNYTLRDMASLAEEGDESCIKAIQSSASGAGDYLAPIIAILDPEAVVIGGGVPDIGDLWWQAFTESIANFSLKSVRNTPILKAEMGNRAGMIGSAILALRKIG